MTFDNVNVAPGLLCIVMYDVHSGNLNDLSGGHSPRSAEAGHNDDNSAEDGNNQGTVSCTGSVNMHCNVDKTEASCQSQATIDVSYNAWLNSVTATGCNGVLTNNSTGAPPASGGSRTVTWTYTQTGCPNQQHTTTCTATFTVPACTMPPIVYPDINITYVNEAVGGNVSTNDVVPAGTIYNTSAPSLVSKPAGSTYSFITFNANGTYNFTADMVGVYVFKVPVQAPGQVAPYPNSLLTITVLCRTCVNAPVANTDIAMTPMNTPVTLKTLINDKAGNQFTSLVPGSVTVTVAALHGTSSINPLTGDNTYTPNNGYTGMDTLTYSVCDNQAPAKCATALQIITILPNTSTNTTLAADDYAFTAMNTPVSGNAMLNDSDPEGNAQSITPQTTTIAGKGTLVLQGNGNFTFTPVTGFTGPVNYPYTTTDVGGTPVATANATIYILVSPILTRDLAPNITAVPSIMHGTTQFNVTVKVGELLGAPTDGSEILVRIPKDAKVTFTWNPTATMIGFTPVNNSAWTYDGTDPFFHLFKTNTTIGPNGFSTFGFVATFTPGQTQGKFTLSASLNSGSGGENNTSNNQDAESLDYFIN
jgi:hypothetical protein